MKRGFAWCLLFGACVLSYAANALTPAQGLWYNPNESGRGLDIEIQNNVMSVATYVYDVHGIPVWYTSSGIYNEAALTFTGSFDSAVGGQCFGCPYVRPVLTSDAGGPMQIVFTSYETGTLHFQGGSTPIQHFNFGYAGKQGYLQGEWAFSMSLPTLGSSNLISTEWIVFSGTYTGSDGTVYEHGTEDGNSSVIALGKYDAASDEFAIVIGGGFGQPLSYRMSGDNSRMSGSGWIGAAFSGYSYLSVGSRLHTPSELSAGAQTVVKSAQVQDARFEALESILRAPTHKDSPGDHKG